MTLYRGQWTRVALVATAALAVSACESTGSYRVASVGASSAGAPQDTSTADGGSSSDGSGGAASGGSGSGSGNSGSGSGTSTTQGGLGKRVLVTSGNAVIGAAGAQSGVTAGIPGVGVASATVTGALNSTGQTLVELGNGSTLVLNGKGGALGDVVSIDFGKGKVVGGPNGSPLVGLNVLARNPSTGRLATVGGSNTLVSVNAPATGGLLKGGPVPQGGGLLRGVTSGGVSTSATGNASPTGISVGSATNAVTQPVTGVLNLNGAVTPKKPK